MGLTTKAEIDFSFPCPVECQAYSTGQRVSFSVFDFLISLTREVCIRYFTGQRLKMFHRASVSECQSFRNVRPRCACALTT